MVKEVTKDNVDYFLCEACSACYKNQELAQKCEDFCKKNNACNPEIMQHAIGVEQGGCCGGGCNCNCNC